MAKTKPTKAASKAPKAGPKTAAKAAPKASKASKPSLRGQVSMTIKDVLAYVGGDDSTVINVSKRSLVEAKNNAATANALADLESFDNSDL